MESGFIVAEHGGEGSINLAILILVLLGVIALLATILVIQQRDPDRVRRMELRRAMLSGPPPRMATQPKPPEGTPDAAPPEETTAADATEATAKREDTGSAESA